MDELQRIIYKLKLDLEMSRSRGTEFQTLFEKIMTRAYRLDFQAIRPYGKKGDLKCDGYLMSQKIVFQCYAPDELKDTKLITKITEDFHGAKEHWGDKMKKWIFVHNGRSNRLPATVLQKIIDLKNENPEIEITMWSSEELKQEFCLLDESKMKELYDDVPTTSTLDNIGYKDIKIVISALETKNVIPDQIILAPSADKLSHNDLSESVAEFLRIGRRREGFVEHFFNEWPSPTLGEEIAQAFRERYQSLKTTGMNADKIFSHLEDFAGGMNGSVERQASVLAIMSYFFERCDIFEDATAK